MKNGTCSWQTPGTAGIHKWFHVKYCLLSQPTQMCTCSYVLQCLKCEHELWECTQGSSWHSYEKGEKWKKCAKEQVTYCPAASMRSVFESSRLRKDRMESWYISCKTYIWVNSDSRVHWMQHSRKRVKQPFKECCGGASGQWFMRTPTRYVAVGERVLMANGDFWLEALDQSFLDSGLRNISSSKHRDIQTGRQKDRIHSHKVKALQEIWNLKKKVLSGTFFFF